MAAEGQQALLKRIEEHTANAANAAREAAEAAKSYADEYEADKVERQGFKEFCEEMRKAQEKQNEFVTNYKPNGAPIPGAEGKALAKAFEQNGRSFFKGKQRLGYRYLLGHVGSEYPLIEKGTDDHRILKTLSEAHDAVVVRRHVLMRKYPEMTESERRDRLMKSSDWQIYCRARVEAGYDESPDSVNQKYAKGSFAQAHDPEADVQFKADEIVHADSGGDAATLDFTFLTNRLLERSKEEWIAAAQFDEFRLPRANTTMNIETLDALAVLGGHSDYAATAGAPPKRDFDQNTHPPISMLSSQGFALVTWNAKHYVTVIPYNDDVEGDSIIAWTPRMQSQGTVGYVRATDRVTLEGDKSATHMDAVGGGNPAIAWPDARIQAYGLRKMSLTNFAIDGAGVGVTLAKFDATHALMGLHGRIPSRVVCFAPVTQAYKLMQLPEVTKANESGGQGSIQTGMAGSLRGINIIVPEWIRTDLETTGVYNSGGNTDRTYLQFARKDRFAWGRMNGLRVESFRYMGEMVTYMQSDIRQDFQAYDVQQMSSGVFTASASGSPATILKNLA